MTTYTVTRLGSTFNGRTGSTYIPRPRYHDADTDTWLTTDKDFADAKIGTAGVSCEGLTLCFWDRWGCEPTIAFFYFDELNIKRSE